MIAAVGKPGGGYQFFDLTAEIVPYGEIPPSEQGEFGLLVHDDGAKTEVIFPSLPLTANRIKTTLVGSLTADGAFRGRWTSIGTGNMQYSMRGSMSSTTKPDSTERARRLQAWANSVVAGSSGDSLELFDGRDLNAVPRYALVVRGGKLLTDAGSSAVLELPIRNIANPTLVKTLEARGPRKMPIDAGKVSGNGEYLSELRLTLPAGWRAKLPDNVQARSVFGTYEATYAQVGKELRITRRYVGATGVFGVKYYRELLDWLGAKGSDDVKVIVLEK